MYRLEKQMEPNVAVELDSTLENQSTLEFCLVRENSEFGQYTPRLGRTKGTFEISYRSQA